MVRTFFISSATLLFCLPAMAEHPALKFGAPDTGRIIDQGKYVLSYDGRLRAARWVAERLTKESLEDTEGVARKDDFLKEPNAPEEFRATNADYKNSGFNRGHLAPAADYRLTQEEVDKLAEGTRVMVKWCGGNGPHEYLVSRRYGQVCACCSPDSRRADPLTPTGSLPAQNRVFLPLQEPKRGTVDTNHIRKASLASPNIGWPIIGQLCDEIDRLNAILDKLPKTADGVPAYPGMEVRFYNSQAVVRSIYDGGEYGFCVTVEDKEGPQGFVPLKDAYSKTPETPQSRGVQVLDENAGRAAT